MDHSAIGVLAPNHVMRGKDLEIAVGRRTVIRSLAMVILLNHAIRPFVVAMVGSRNGPTAQICAVHQQLVGDIDSVTIKPLLMGPLIQQIAQALCLVVSIK